MYNITTLEETEFFEKYPHIGTKLQLLWGSIEGRQYLLDLLQDKGRDVDFRNARSGFPMKDAKFIMQLIDQHDDLFPTCILPEEPYFLSIRPKRTIVQHDNLLFWIAAIITVLISIVIVKVISLHWINS
jgi:hypothetical protein